MASTYYDWHLETSRNRMNQKPLAFDCVVVDRYHHKNGLVLNFRAETGKQISMLLDHADTIVLKKSIRLLFPDDEIAQLKRRISDLENQLEDYVNSNQQ